MKHDLDKLPENHCQFSHVSAMVIGGGAVGSCIIEYLAKQGIGHLTIVDYDHFTLANACKHSALVRTPEDANKSKSLALAQRAQTLMIEGGQANAIHGDITNLDVFALEAYHAIFLALDNRAAELYVNQLWLSIPPKNRPLLILAGTTEELSQCICLDGTNACVRCLYDEGYLHEKMHIKHSCTGAKTRDLIEGEFARTSHRASAMAANLAVGEFVSAYLGDTTALNRRLTYQPGLKAPLLVSSPMKKQNCPHCSSTTWGVLKEELREVEHNSPTTYVSFPVIGSAQYDALYHALDGSGCTISIQMIPQRITPEDKRFIQQSYANVSRAAKGTYMLQHMSGDGLATFSQQRWDHILRTYTGATALVNVVVSGPSSSAAMLVARFNGALVDHHNGNGVAMHTIPLPTVTTIYNQPWQYLKNAASICKKIGYTNPKLAMHMSTQEVAALLSLPSGTICAGLPKNAQSLFPKKEYIPKSFTTPESNTLSLGKTVQGTPLVLPLNELSLHMSIFGKTGVGKTTLLTSIIDQLLKKHIPTLILEPVKREYRSLAHNAGTKVFTADDTPWPFILNPFYVPSGVTLGQYRPHLLQAFLAAFSMPDPLPSLFGAAISEAYAQYGWKNHSKSTDPDIHLFGLWEFTQVFKKIVASSDYSKEVKGNMMSGGAFRLLSLLERSQTFDAIHSIDVEDLLSGQVVLELGHLEGADKSLVAAMTMISILSYLRNQRESGGGLQNVIVLDEAHALLDIKSGQTVESCAADQTMSQLITNFIAEMRALGVAIILADQSPNRIGTELLDHTETRIFFRLSGSETLTAAQAVGLNEMQSNALSLLDCGQTIFMNHHISAPVSLCTHDRPTPTPVTNQQLTKLATGYIRAHSTQYRPFLQCEHCSQCQVSCLNDVRDLSNTLSIQMCQACHQKVDTTETLIGYLLSIPLSLEKQNYGTHPQFSKLCGCTAVHFYRRVEMATDLHLLPTQLEQILSRIDQLAKNTQGGTTDV